MDANALKDISLSEIYSNAEELSRSNLRLYTNLLRVGTSIIFAAIGFAVIVVLLFAPSFDFLPYGRFTQVILGVIGSFVAFKLYGFFKLSNAAFLNAGRSEFRPSEVGRKFTKTGFRRILSILLSAFSIIALLIVVVIIFEGFPEYLGYRAEGIPAEISEELKILLLISVLFLEMGLLINVVGLGLVLWALMSPIVTFIFSYFRLKKSRWKHKADSVLENRLSISFYVEPNLVCDMCYNTTFYVAEEEEIQEREYEVICSNCHRSRCTFNQTYDTSTPLDSFVRVDRDT